jgi:hypothetical protein
MQVLTLVTLEKGTGGKGDSRIGLVAMPPGIQCKNAHVPPHETLAEISRGINHIGLNNASKTVNIAGGWFGGYVRPNHHPLSHAL